MKYLQMHSSGDDTLVAPLFSFVEIFFLFQQRGSMNQNTTQMICEHL